MMDNKALSASSILAVQNTNGIQSPASTRDVDKAKKAAQDFEAVFITEMMKPMFESIEVDETFGGGKGEEIFKSLMTQEYGKLFAQRGGIGLADNVQAELLKIQEHNATSTETKGA